jgi:hypothetical protein
MMAVKEFRPHRPVDLSEPMRTVLTRNYVRMFQTEPTESDLVHIWTDVEDPTGKTVRLVARWAAAAMICPYPTEGVEGASYCGATRCRHWVDDGENNGTCARCEQS